MISNVPMGTYGVLTFGRNSSVKHKDFNSRYTGFNHICKFVLQFFMPKMHLMITNYNY